MLRYFNCTWCVCVRGMIRSGLFVPGTFFSLGSDGDLYLGMLALGAFCVVLSQPPPCFASWWWWWWWPLDHPRVPVFPFFLFLCWYFAVGQLLFWKGFFCFFFALLVSLSHPLRAAVTIPLRREVIDHAIVYPKGALLLSTFVAFKRGRGEATTGTLSLR